MTVGFDSSPVVEDAIAIYNDRLSAGDNYRAAFMAAVAFVSAKDPELNLNDISTIIIKALGIDINELEYYRVTGAESRA